MGGSEVRAGERPIPVLGLLVAVQGQGERLPGSGGEGELVWQTMSAAPPLPPLPSSHLPSPPLPSPPVWSSSSWRWATSISSTGKRQMQGEASGATTTTSVDHSPPPLPPPPPPPPP